MEKSGPLRCLGMAHIPSFCDILRVVPRTLVGTCLLAPLALGMAESQALANQGFSKTKKPNLKTAWLFILC